MSPHARLASAAAAVGLLAVALPGTAAAADSNHDGIPDRWEKRHGLSLKVDQAKRDQDRDALVNKREFRFGFDPGDDDSDDDGVEDGDEQSGVITGWDPATGSLTIRATGGQEITGLVTDDTEVSCDDGDDQGDEDEDGEGGNRGPGPNSGPGDGDDDEDHSGPGHDGDDAPARWRTAPSQTAMTTPAKRQATITARMRTGTSAPSTTSRSAHRSRRPSSRSRTARPSGRRSNSS